MQLLQLGQNLHNVSKLFSIFLSLSSRIIFYLSITQLKMRQFLYIIVTLLLQAPTVMSKDKEAYTMDLKVINSKMYLNPKYNLFDCEKYMLPKLDIAPVHHTFYQPQELQEMYKEMKINTDDLNHNLDKSSQSSKMVPIKKKSQKIEDSSVSDVKDESISIESSVEMQKIPRPKLRETGCTHFIHVPLWDVLKQVYINQIVPRIEEEDRDLLMPLSSMHMTVLAFRLRKIEDLPAWSQVLKSAKKSKILIKGVNIFPVKKNNARVLFLNIKGAQDLIDRIVSKAIQLQLISQSELSHIKFDKVSGTYKAEAHISLLRTKGDDLFDFTEYLKTLNKITIPKATTSEIRLSVIGSHDGNDYFNEEIVQL